MSLVVGQIVYSSFPQIGYQSFANTEIPERVQTAFVEEIIHEHWDVYEPPPPGFKAGFIHQTHPEHTLFGWLLNDGDDDHGRPHTPYCLAYYLHQTLDAHVTNFMVQCLEKGPVNLISRQVVPELPEQLEIIMGYEPAVLGVTITDLQKQQILQNVQQQSLLQCFYANSCVLVSLANPQQPHIHPTDELFVPQTWPPKRQEAPRELEEAASSVPTPLVAAVAATASPQRVAAAVGLSHGSLKAPKRQGLATMTAGGPAAGPPPGRQRPKRKAQSEDLASQIISILDETL